MTDSIDRAKAIKAIEEMQDCYNGFSGTYDKAQIIGVLEEVPQVDAVEVIRCKDCKYQDKGENEAEAWNVCVFRPWLHTPIDDEHFCGNAERKADG